MKLILALALLAPAAYADTYTAANEVMQEVARDNRYIRYGGMDYRPMTKHEVGNCARFAATYAHKMKERGIQTGWMRCALPDGRQHTFALTHDGWAMDNMKTHPIRFEETDCDPRRQGN